MRVRRTNYVRRKNYGGLLTELDIKPNADKTRLEYRFRFGAGNDQSDEIAFSTSAAIGMAIMGLLQRLQAEHRFPIPATHRSTSPVELRLVETDDDESQP